MFPLPSGLLAGICGKACRLVLYFSHVCNMHAHLGSRFCGFPQAEGGWGQRNPCTAQPKRSSLRLALSLLHLRMLLGLGGNNP